MSNKKVPAVPFPSSSLIILSPLSEISACGYDYRLVMVRRNAKSSFKNATVFPGGNMDDCDHDQDTPFDKMKPSMNAFKRCAIREAFEETGILVSSPRVKFESGDRKRWRNNVHDSGAAFETLLSTYKTSIKLDELVHYANWITPVALPRRYDTNFFISIVDSAETLPARHDNSETLQINHFTPLEAVAAHKRGEIVLFMPQLYMLQDLALFKSYFKLLGVVAQRPVVTTEPLMKPELGCVALPGDESLGGKSGTLNRIAVSFVDGNLSPSRVLRHDLEGFEDIDTGDVPTSVEADLFKEKL